MVIIIKKFKIKVQGFQRNFERAPDTLLTSSIEKELRMPFQRGKKKSTSLQQVYDLFTAQLLKELPGLETRSLEEFNTYIEMNQIHSKATIISFLKSYFPETYEEKKNIIHDNVLNKRLLLEGVVKFIPTEKKFEQIESRLLEQIMVHKKLEYYEFIAEDKIGKKQYQTYKEQVNQKGEDSLIAMLLQTPDSLQHILILAFLLEEKRFKLMHYKVFLTYVIMRFEEEKEINLNHQLKEKDTQISEIKRKYQRLNTKYRTISKTMEKYEEEEKNYQNLLQTYKLLKDKQEKLNIKIEKNQPFVSFFINMALGYPILLVTNDTQLFTCTPFEKCVISVDQFQKDRKNKDLSKYKDKYIFVTRISFSNTSQWMACRKFFIKNGLKYCELSGYDFEDYIKQMTEYLYIKEYEHSW